MVNAEDPALKANRLGLLAALHETVNRVADLSRLARKQDTEQLLRSGQSFCFAGRKWVLSISERQLFSQSLFVTVMTVEKVCLFRNQAWL
jgi:hypothetical protein